MGRCELVGGLHMSTFLHVFAADASCRCLLMMRMQCPHARSRAQAPSQALCCLLSVAQCSNLADCCCKLQAALGVNNSLFSLCFVVFNFLSVATTPTLAAALAANDKKRVCARGAGAVPAGGCSGSSSERTDHPCMLHGFVRVLPALMSCVST